MKTAEGWYRLVKSWQAQLLDIPVEKLTMLEASILEDMNRHLLDMEVEQDHFDDHTGGCEE